MDCSKPVDDKIMEIGEWVTSSTGTGLGGQQEGVRAMGAGQPHGLSSRERMTLSPPSRTQHTKLSSHLAIMCSTPRSPRAASFQKFLTDKIKVDGRPGMLGESIKVGAEKSKVTITSDIHLSKR